MDDWFRIGFEEARLALMEVVAKANLHLAPVKLGATLARQTRTRLKLLETIHRRLIFLLALSVTLEPSKPHPARKPAPLPDGVEDLTHIFPKPRRYRLRLIWSTRSYSLNDAGVLQGLPRRTGPVLAGPLIVRAHALMQALNDPEGHARRVARAIAKSKAKGETCPDVPPLPEARRLRRGLSVVSDGLPMLIRKAWDSCADTS